MAGVIQSAVGTERRKEDLQGQGKSADRPERGRAVSAASHPAGEDDTRGDVIRHAEGGSRGGTFRDHPRAHEAAL